MFIGPAIAYLILGSALYRFRSALRLQPEPMAEFIGFAFWWGGWIALCWTSIAMLLKWPEPLEALGVVLAVLWAGSRGIKIARQLMK